MKMRIFVLLGLLLPLSCVHARTWTDTQGRSLEADMVSADGQSVSVLSGGRQLKLPLDKLSQADQDYVQQWLKEHEAEKTENGDDFTPSNDSGPTNNGGGDNGGGNDQPKPKPQPQAGEMTFDGQPMKTGGFVNKYEYPYDEKRMEMMKKWKSDDTGFKIGIAVPNGFDPSKPQKVFIPMTAINNDSQAKMGNISQMHTFAKNCVDNGWVCITFDTNLGRKNHDADLYMTFEKLNEVWPNSKSWDYASGGFSGGSKVCWSPISYLVKNEYNVVGAMLLGCNAVYAESNRDRYKASKTGYKNIKVMLSNGNNDTIAPVAGQDSLEDVLNKSGMRQVRKMNFDGGHGVSHDHIVTALKWFSEKE